MDPGYLAKNDGSAESAGRGRGLEAKEERGKGIKERGEERGRDDPLHEHDLCAIGKEAGCCHLQSSVREQCTAGEAICGAWKCQGQRPGGKTDIYQSK